MIPRAWRTGKSEIRVSEGSGFDGGSLYLEIETPASDDGGWIYLTIGQAEQLADALRAWAAETYKKQGGQ